MSLLRWFCNPDRIFALVMIAVSCVMYLLTGGMEEPYSPGALAASTYPRLILGCIVIVSCLLLARPAGDGDRMEQRFSRQGITVIILLAVYTALLERVGFFVLTPALLFAVPLVAGYRRFGVILISVVAVTGVLYGVFVGVLNIPLPPGLLGD